MRIKILGATLIKVALFYIENMLFLVFLYCNYVVFMLLYM